MIEPAKVNLNDTMDAMIWADEFMRIFGEKIHQTSGECIDHDLMLSWFANAIMAGFDEATRREQKKVQKLLSIVLLTDPALSSIQMNELSIKQFDVYERWCQTQT